jgi:hypothetical protein
MIRTIVFLLLITALMACSPQKKLARKYMGAGREVLVTTLGEPQREERLENGNVLLVYRKETVIRPTTVATGRFTPDPMVSPGYLKVRESSFLLNPQGIVIETGFKEEIER